MPLQATSGAASYDAFGGGVPFVPTYIEDVMSVWLYTGNGSTQTITNGIDLAGKGGAVFAKSRTNASGFPSWFDTNRGALKRLQSSSTLQEGTVANSLTAFNSDGFSVGSVLSASSENFVGWTFRKQPKFFDVVTYTGDGASSRNIAHNLGSVPGCFIVKETNYSGTNWRVYHRSLGNTNEVYLNTTAASTATTSWASTTPTSAVFTVGVSGGAGPNDSGSNYVAYLFAHDAGGFGLTGTDNVISCGGTALNASGFATVSLGYEPQFVMIKSTEFAGDWAIYDTMRGAVALKSSDLFSAFSAQKLLANSSAAESTATDYAIAPNATGFTLSATGYAGAAFDNFIYIAIRRGPMKVPTTGTSVFKSIARTGTGVVAQVTGVGFSPDLYVVRNTYGIAELGACFIDRLRGNPYLNSSDTGASAASPEFTSLDMNGVTLAAQSNGMANYQYADGVRYINYFFKRAPGFFDVVCYTGTGSATTFSHSLQAVPELMIVKSRNNASDWLVYNAPDGPSKTMFLNETYAAGTNNSRWNNTTPTSSVFSVGTGETNQSGWTYVNYLFATCPGVSKVGSYTGTGTTQIINCGFTGGARFVLIKRTDSTGDWYVWDSARGIVAGNDPYLLLNSTAAEVTSTDYIDTASTGFEISSTAPAAINASGGSFIFLAIA
jgi:hypothetical protein